MVQLASLPETKGRQADPQVTVVITNYNGSEYLDACLSSVLATALGAEVIVVDNASTDQSRAVLERWSERVHTVALPANVGYGEANNLGAAMAQAPYVVFLNPDTQTEPGWLEPLINVLEGDPGCGLVTPKIVKLREPDRINTCGLDVHITGLTLCRGLGQARDQFRQLENTTSISGAACAVRKRLFMDVGGFDRTFFLYMEDTDLSWRVQEAGYSCRFVPGSVVRHDYSLRLGPLKTFYQERNRYLMLLKSLHWATLIAMLPILVLAEVVTWGFVLVQQRRYWRNKIDAYIWVVENWNQIMYSRRQVQSCRRIRDHQLLEVCTHRLAYEQVGQSVSTRAAQVIFDPLFRFLQRAVLAVVQW